MLLATILALAGGDAIQLRDPTFYPVLRDEGAKLECRYLRGMVDYGVDLERRAGNKVHVTLVTNGVREGEKSAFDAAIQSSSLHLTYLLYQKREGDYGTYIEIVVETRSSSDVNYRLPARIMMTSSVFSKDGSEEKIPDALHRMGCKPPALAR